jgi:hypothetical protein
MPTVIIGDNTGDDFAGTDDSLLSQASPTTNYGSSNEIGATKFAGGDHYNTLLSFSGISSLPSSLSVSSVTLGLYLKNAGGASTQTLSIKRLLRNWIEAQATWNIFATSSNWTTGGALSDGNDRSATTSASISSNGTTGVYQTVTDTGTFAAIIEDYADGTLVNYGEHIERTDGADDSTYRVFTSSEGTDGQRPYLIVTYTSGPVYFDETITEGIKAGDTIASLGIMVESVTEGIKAGDTITDVGILVESITEGIKAGDTVNEVRLLVESITEGTVATDFINETLVFEITVEEGTTASDVISALAIFGEVVTEGVEASDSNSTLEGTLFEGKITISVFVKVPCIKIETKQIKISVTPKTPTISVIKNS